jgi:hypothetical protein
MTLFSASDTPLQSLHRLTMHSMINPLNSFNYHPSSNKTVIVRPSLIIPISLDRKSCGNRGKLGAGEHQNGHHDMSKLSCTTFFDSLHRFNLDRAEEAACNTFGLDFRSGSPRD